MTGRAFIDLARQAAWLDAGRARIYGRLVAIAVVLGAVGQFGQIAASTLHDPLGRPIATDFDAFWSATRLALTGRPAAAYDEAAIRAAETAGAQPTGAQFLPYLYPPPFLLLSLPIGLMPYLPAMLAFALCGYLPWCLVLRRLLPSAWPLSLILALPACMMNAVIGQSGFIAAFAFGMAALTLERRPAVAGASLGLLVCKPHLALAVPVALLAARRWRALLACAASVLILAAASWAAFGSSTWVAFFRTAPLTGEVLLSPSIWNKLLSVYAGIRLLHGPAATALALQAASAALVLAALGRVVSRRPGGRSEVAAMTSAAMLCTPYLLDYDLVCLAVPLAWLAAEAAISGWRPWEKALLAVLYLYPLVARDVNVATCVPLAPPLLAGLFFMVATRSWTRAGVPHPTDAVSAAA